MNMNMWGLVASIQQTLDEAAGLNGSSTGEHNDQNKTASSREAPTNAESDDASQRSSSPNDQEEHQDDNVPVLSHPPRCDSGAVGTPDPCHASAGGHQVAIHSDAEATTERTTGSAAAVTQASAEDDFLALLQHKEMTIADLEHKNRCLAEQLDQQSKQLLLKASAPSGDNALITALQREGAELSKNLGAERERCKAFHAEKKALEAQVAELLTAVENHRAAEKAALQARDALAEADQVLKSRIAELELLSIKQADEVQRVTSESQTLHDHIAASQAKLLEQERRHDDAFSVEREQHQKAVDQLREEIFAVKQLLRQTASSHEVQVTTLQRDLSAAVQRAHIAETRLLDSSCESSSTAQQLSTELNSVMAELEKVKQDNAVRREEAFVLQQTIRNLHDERTATELQHQRNLNSLNEDRKRLAVELSSFSSRQEKDRLRIDELLRQNSALRLEIERLQAAASEAIHDNVAVNHPQFNVVTTSSSGKAGAEQFAALSQHASAVSQPQALFSNTTAPRVEREVARLTREVRRLKSFETECSDLRRQLDTLLPQHDMLLQMYGQLQEEVADARSDATAAKSVYHDQIVVLGHEVQRLQAKLGSSNANALLAE